METKKTYNIYCDESCHLLNDKNKTFVLGAVWVSKDKTSEIFQDLRNIKVKHNLSENFEAKWTKISPAKADYYCDLAKYFFSNENLHFRGVVVPDKSILDHSAFGQDHNTWYYKMFYVLLNQIVSRDTETSEYSLYLDIKDTKSNLKVQELQRILNIASVEDVFTVSKAQQIRSHEVELMQLVDILIGALSYTHRALSSNEGKKKVIEVIKSSIGETEMLTSSAKDEDKFNVLVWRPKK